MSKLPYVVECKWPGRFYEPIAAFNDDTIALQYAVDCAVTNLHFGYRVVYERPADTKLVKEIRRVA